MRREGLNELSAFVAVADAGSFTKAAARLSMSPSALSHALRALEAWLDVRLLARTTRSVAPTAAGERLLNTLRPAFADIDAGLTDLGAAGSTRWSNKGSKSMFGTHHQATRPSLAMRAMERPSPTAA